MKLKCITALTCILIVLIDNQYSFGELIVNEGETYILDYQEDHCIVPFGSTLIVQDGGYADLADFWPTSKLIMNGGFIYGVVSAENITAKIYGGEITNLSMQGVFEIMGGCVGGANNEGYSYIRGGSISDLDVGPSSHAWITGGSIDYVNIDRSEAHIFGTGVNNLHIWWGGEVYIYADQFKLDGIDIGYGTLYSDQLSGSHILEYTLSNGMVGKTDIYMDYGAGGYISSITLIPEPATVLLLGIGSIISRRR